jgi:oxygen-dependent protoporphyrinogen oxidase
MPATSLLGIPGHPWERDVRRVIGLSCAVRASVDRFIRPTDGPRPSLDAVVARRVGRRVVNRLIAPITGGVYARQPDEIDVDEVLPALRTTIAKTGSLTRAVRELCTERPASGGAIAGITGGIGLLTEALTVALDGAGGRLALSQTVTGLGCGVYGWDVWTGGPNPRHIAAPIVVIATPIGMARALLAQATGRLPADRPTPVEVVTLVVDHAALDAAPRGTGLLVAPDAPDVHAKALTHATAKWPWLEEAAGPGRHVLRLSYAAGAAPRTGDVPIDRALDDASVLLGMPLRRNHLAGHSSVHYPDQLTPRPRTPLPAEFPGLPGLAVAGSARTGPGLAAVIADATATARRLMASA